MKLNDIKFLPNANAFSDVYDKATGMPFVGEMMVAAAGQESEPTPDPEPDPEPTSTEFTVSNVRAVEYEYSDEMGTEILWTIQADANMDATGYTVYVQGDNDAFYCYLTTDEEDPTKLVIDGNEESVIDNSLLSDGGDYTGWYREEGVVEDQTIQGTYTVVPMQRGPIEISNFGFEKDENDNWKCGAESNLNAVGYDIIVEGSASEFNVRLFAEEQDPTLLIMDENYENFYIGDICGGGNWTAHTSYNGTDFQDQTGTYEDPCTDCENEWEEQGYSSYEDCECQANGNCGEEEPEE